MTNFTILSCMEFILLNAYKFQLNEADFLYLLISLMGFNGITKKLQYMFGNWNANFFWPFLILFHPWLPSVTILMIKVFADSRILLKKIFAIRNFWFRLTDVLFRRNYFILAQKSPKILVQSFFHPWQKANFPSMTIGIFFLLKPKS